jgi:hypothetical protein
MYRRMVWYKFTDELEKVTVSVFTVENHFSRKMEAAYLIEMTVNFYQTTRCHIQEDGFLLSDIRFMTVDADVW